MLTDVMQRHYLERIANGLKLAAASVKRSVPGSFMVTAAGTRAVTTDVDRKINDLLRASLQTKDEGWLSEEDADDKARLLHKVVWVVDPIDGTREFVDKFAEWCISVRFSYRASCGRRWDIQSGYPRVVLGFVKAQA